MHNYRLVGYTDTGRITFGTMSVEDEEAARVAALNLASVLGELTHSDIHEVRAENIKELMFFFSKVYDKEWKECHSDPNDNP